MGAHVRRAMGAFVIGLLSLAVVVVFGMPTRYLLAGDFSMFRQPDLPVVATVVIVSVVALSLWIAFRGRSMTP